MESPTAKRVNEGDPAIFCPNVFGSLPLAYEWYKDGVLVEGGTQLCLTIDAAQEEDEGSYWVTVTNPYGEAMSMPARLTVVQPGDYPMIIEQPLGTNVNVGDMVTLCVTATGTDPIRYQWRKNGLNLPGETNACLLRPSVSLEDGGDYRVVVENDYGAVTSDPAIVTILGVVVMPGADDFEDRVPLGGDSGQVRGNNSAATKQVPAEPKHAHRPGKHSHWYTWTPSADGIATFSTAGSNFDTLLAVYTGATLDALVPVAADEDGGKFYTSEVRFNAVQGQAYAIAIDGFANRSGDYVLSWELEVTAEALPVVAVNGQPQSLVVEALGADAGFTVVATGDDLTYQWYRNGASIPNATQSSYSIDAVTPGDLGRYMVRITSGSRMVTTAPATLEVGNLGGYPTRDKVEDLLLDAEFEEDMGAGGSLGGGVPLLSLGFIGQQIWNNTESGNQVGEANHCDMIGSASTWFRFQVEADGILQVDTTGMETRPALAIYTNILEGQGALTDLYPNLSAMACSDPLVPGASNLRTALRVGVNYWLAVDNAEGEQGTNFLNWRFGSKARLQEPALVALLPDGTNVFLDAGMISATPPPEEVQWYLNNDPIVGYHSTVIPLYALSRDLSGVFRVVLGNFAGRTTNVVGVVSTFDQFKFKNYQQFGFVSGRTNFTIVATFSVPVVIEAADVLCSTPEALDCTEWVPVYTNEVPNVSFEFVDPDALFPGQPGIEDPSNVKPARFYRMQLFVPEQ